MGGSHTDIDYDMVTYKFFFSKTLVKYFGNKRSIKIDPKRMFSFHRQVHRRSAERVQH